MTRNGGEGTLRQACMRRICIEKKNKSRGKDRNDPKKQTGGKPNKRRDCHTTQKGQERPQNPQAQQKEDLGMKLKRRGKTNKDTHVGVDREQGATWRGYGERNMKEVKRHPQNDGIMQEEIRHTNKSGKGQK